MVLRRFAQVLLSALALVAVSLVVPSTAGAAVDEFDTRSWCTTDAHPRLFFPFGGSSVPDSFPSWQLKQRPSGKTIATGTAWTDLTQPNGPVEIKLPAGLPAGPYSITVPDTSIPDGLWVEAYDCVTAKVACAKVTFTNPSPSVAARVELFSASPDVSVMLAPGRSADVRVKPGNGGWIAVPEGADHVDDMGNGSLEVPTCASLTATPRPVLTGKPRVGQTLHADPGSWKPAPVTLTYRWRRNGAPITGATGLTYTPTSADLGKYLSFQVTGRKTGYWTSVQVSPDTPRIKPTT